MKAPSSGSTMFVLCGTVQVYNSCTDVHWQYYHAVVVSISSSGQCLVVALISVCVNILQSYETRISECGLTDKTFQTYVTSESESRINML